MKVAAMSRQLKEAEAASASIVKKAMEQKEITDAALAKSERELALHKDLLKVASGGAGGGGGGSSSSASAAVGGESKAPTDFHAGISDWVNKHVRQLEVLSRCGIEDGSRFAAAVAAARVLLPHDRRVWLTHLCFSPSAPILPSCCCTCCTLRVPGAVVFAFRRPPARSRCSTVSSNRWGGSGWRRHRPG